MSKRSNRTEEPPREPWVVRSRQGNRRRMDLRGRSEQGYPPVVADGDRTRYQGGTYGCTWKEWALCVNLGGTAGFEVLSQ